MKTLLTLLALCLCTFAPAWGQNTVQVSTPLSYQIDAKGQDASGESLARLSTPGNTVGVPLGEWLEFNFLKPVTLSSMTVVNGWASPEAFRQHARVRTAVLHYADGGKQTLGFRDTDKPQTFSIKGSGPVVRMTVSAVYPGRASTVPHLSGVSFAGYDPAVRQVRLTGRFEGCVKSRSSSSWSGNDEPLYYCARFRADDGAVYGCADDQCFHVQNLVNVQLNVVGVVKEGNVLEVLEAKPLR
uniref:NAD glycohydrolase translocation F5/8 type C domain-containing protein n=1 Tax=Fundidesulfovibrio putealis TaxID=270496 RepID=A0A7C4AA56_9BACT